MSVLSVSQLVKRHGSQLVIDRLDLSLDAGEIVSVLGPSGCGKTTLLRCVAGLEDVTDGTISINGRVVSSARSSTPPERRNIGLVFQSYALWPHLTVFDNIALGLKIRKMPKAEIAKKIATALDRLELQGLGARFTSQISGGQQQRVALARALVLEPQILLFDEPLSNLDARIRERVRGELHDLLRTLGITTLYVTHDKSEAMALSDRIVVMRDGVVEQIGSGRDIYERPASVFVADFIGRCNVLPVRPAEPCDSGVLSLGSDTLALTNRETATAFLAFRPDVAVIGSSELREGLTARIIKQTYYGGTFEVVAEVGDQKIMISSTQPVDGDTVSFTIAPHNLSMFTKHDVLSAAGGTFDPAVL